MATGSMDRKTGKGLQGDVAATGTVGRGIAKSITGLAKVTGIVVRKTGKALSLATVVATGTISRKAFKTLFGAAKATAIVERGIAKTIAGNVDVTGFVGRGITRLIATAAVKITATANRKTGKNLATPTVAVTASMNRKTGKDMLGQVTAVATIPLRRIWKTISATVTASPTVNRKISKTITASVIATGIVVRLIDKLIYGGVAVTATVGRVIKKVIAATVTARGIVTRIGYDMAYEMNKTIRQILAKVQITYTNPFFSAGIEASATETGQWTYPEQVTDNVTTEAYKWFSLNTGGGNLLDGTFHLLPSNKEYSVGWWNTTESVGPLFMFMVQPILTIEHAARTIESLLVVGDDKLEEYPVRFEINLYSAGDVLVDTIREIDNGAVTWTSTADGPWADIVKQTLTIERWNKVGAVAKISQFFTMLEETYTSEDGDLFSLRVLEEREFQEPTIPQGNISANTISVKLNNIDHLFTEGNYRSRLNGLLLNNRAIKAWLGCDTHSGGRIWFPLGTFYSRNWSAPEDEPWAEVTGYDMLDRLKQTDFTTSEVYTGLTLSALAVIVMTDAGLSAADWEIDAALAGADYVIPYAWFDQMSHREALRRIAAAALGQVYCNRDGKIVIEIYVAPVAQIYDFEFSESNFFDIDHPLKWSQMINSVQARANPLAKSALQDICVDADQFSVPAGDSVTKTHFFDVSPCVDVVDTPGTWVFVNPGGNVTCTAVTTYAWGCMATYANAAGVDEDVDSVTIQGYPLEVQGGRIASAEDATSIASNGRQSLSAPVTSAFWQDETRAQAVADSLLASYKDPRRDVIMKARGNIAELLGDRVVAPDFSDEVTSEFALMRQDINFDGGLTVDITAQRIADGHKITKKSLSAGVVATAKIHTEPPDKTFLAEVKAVGTVGRTIKKTLTASVTADGSVGRTVEKQITSDGVLATGTVDRVKLFHKSLSGMVIAVGSVERVVAKTLLTSVVAGGSTGLYRADFLAASGSGYGRVDNDLYSFGGGAWVATDADSMQTNVSYGVVGQAKGNGSPRYTVMRLYPIFDTSVISAGATILQAELFFASSSNSVEKSTDMVVQNGQPTYPHNPAVIGDYDKDHYSGDGGSIELQGKSTDTYYSFLLNATGEGWMQVNGITKLCLRSEHDIAGSAPSEEPDERCRIYLCDGTYPMYLRITWTE